MKILKMAVSQWKYFFCSQQTIIACVIYIAVFGVSDSYHKVHEIENSGDVSLKTIQDGDSQMFHFTTDFFSTPVKDKDLKNTKSSLLNVDNLIPDHYKIVFTVELDDSLPETEIIQSLRKALSRVLQIPMKNIKISKYEAGTGTIQVYLVETSQKDGSNINLVLLPASEIVSKLPMKRLQKEVSTVKILDVKSGENVQLKKPTNGKSAWGIFHDQNWKAWQLAIIIASCLFAVFCVFVILLFLSARRPTKENAVTIEEPRHIVLHPIMKPVVSNVDIIQPENKDLYVAETDSEHTPSPCRSPLRVKGKGLLERRGSNASLTLDLSRSQENIKYGTPPKECSTEEYLLSAGNRLTRKQLRNCLKDVKALHSEFWEIPMNHPEKVDVAGSGTKNRYKTILPNGLTRVQIESSDDDPLSSYINANYVRGYGGEKNAYIATQGPMTHTVNDFWLMVWEQKSPIIVMITKLKEKLKVKCEPYIPDYKFSYGDIEVTVLKVIPRDGYTIRELHLKKGNVSHTVLHFWYTAWPDHKTPGTAKQLLSMVMEVETLRHDNCGMTKGPTIVHCSAGIGRTGCFIAISIGIQQLLEENMVDVLGIVCGLRLDRGGMVQTAEQYEFVHQALGVFESSLPNLTGE